MVHPNVLKAVKLNPKEWSGFAFGIGTERLAMLKYGIEDVRKMFDGDLRLINQL
jgi:phenylalanyl-tRNA synthetase alpha chain